MKRPCVDQPGFITTYNFRLDDRVAFIAGGIGNAQVYPQFIDVGLHIANFLLVAFQLVFEYIDSFLHSFLLRICPVGLVFLSKGLGDFSSQIFVPVVRPKLNDAGIPELANIYRFFEAFPGHDSVGEFPFFSQLALGNHLV